MWMGFNAIYGGEPDDAERDRVMATVSRFVDAGNARQLLRACEASIARIVEVPPGDMRRDKHDPEFRAASRRCIALYKAAGRSPVDRLAAIAGVLYQVRCNLTHGAKDPESERDRMLVMESVTVLRQLVPTVEAGASNSAQ